MEKRDLIYLDNAATSFPKPYAVSEAVKKYMLYCGGNPGRGAYKTAIEAAEKVYLCREHLKSFFGADENAEQFFVMNTTQGINACIKGYLRRGDHVLISNMEHNAVYRPIFKLAARGQITYDVFCVADERGMLSEDEILSDISRKTRANTRMLICTAASNIVSIHPPIAKIGELCRKRNIFFLVDGAQAAGHFDISVEKMNIDALCVPGHKGLLGPQGCGAVILREGVRLETLFEGGNGVDSLEGAMPEYAPERYESGTLPVPAIIGLNEGITSVAQIGVQNVERHERALFEATRGMLEGIDGVRIYCPDYSGSVLLFSVDGVKSERVAEHLAKCGICVRGGFHCAALAHNALNTDDSGAVRVSFGIFNCEGDAEALCEAVSKIKRLP